MNARTQDAHFFAAARISENMVETPEGFLLCLGVPVARTGELQYAEGELVTAEGEDAVEAIDGMVTVVRDADALFDETTMASFEGKPVTVGHPNDFVNPGNWAQIAVGHMQNVRRGEGDDGDKLIADLLITSASAIDLIKSGLREVSLGYDAMYEEVEPGLGRQTGIVGNHVALVRKGRNGSEVAVRDSAPDHKPRRTTMAIPAKKAPTGLKAQLLKVFGRALDEAMPEENKGPATDEGEEARIANIEAMLAKLLAAAEGTAVVDEEKEEQVASREETAPPAASNPMDARLTAIETALEKLMQAISVGAADQEAPPASAADQQGVICQDAATIARAEILVPGIKNSATLVKDTLAAFAKDEANAAVLKTFDSIADQNSKFIAVAEAVKASRAAAIAVPNISNFGALVGTTDSTGKGPMTPEQINAANEKRWGAK